MLVRRSSAEYDQLFVCVEGEIVRAGYGDLHAGQFGLPAQEADESYIGCVAAGGDADHAGSWCRPGRVPDVPVAVDRGFHDDVEVHRRQTWGVDGRDPGRYVDRAAQSGDQVGEVEADTVPREQGIDRVGCRAARVGLVPEGLPCVGT